MTPFPAKASKPGKHFHEEEGLLRLSVFAKYFIENARLFSWMEFRMSGKPRQHESVKEITVLENNGGQTGHSLHSTLFTKSSHVYGARKPQSLLIRFKNQNLSF